MDNLTAFQTQFKEISGWLGNLFEREDLPDYEINELTVGKLNSVMKSNKNIDKIVHILIDEINRQREEYEAKALILTKKLTDIGLSSESLSQASFRNLNTLSDVALCLKLKDCKYSSFVLGMGEISKKIAQYSYEIAKQEKAMANLENSIIQIVKGRDELKSSLDILQVQSVTEEPILDKRKKEKHFLKVKSKEYHKVIADIESVNNKNGVEEKLFHNTLKTYHRELMVIRSEIDKLKSTLSQYHNLPPDMSLAKVKIAEAQLELQHLEGELYSSLEVLNL